MKRLFIFIIFYLIFQISFCQKDQFDKYRTVLREALTTKFGEPYSIKSMNDSAEVKITWLGPLLNNTYKEVNLEYDAKLLTISMIYEYMFPMDTSNVKAEFGLKNPVKSEIIQAGNKKIMYNVNGVIVYILLPKYFDYSKVTHVFSNIYFQKKPNQK
jgi:hypothetical protein